MKNNVFALILLLPVVVFAQKPYSVSGTGAGFHNGDKVYLVYKIDGKVKTDMVIVNNNAFKFNDVVNGPASATLYQNEDPMVIEVSRNAAQFYLEPGTIKISSPDSMRHAIASGTSSNRDNNILKAELKPLQSALEALNNKFEALTPAQQADIESVSDFRQKTQVIFKAMEPVKFAFVQGHPNSYISIVAINELKLTNAPIKKIAPGYNSINPTLKATWLGKKLGDEIAGQVKFDIGEKAADFTQPDVKNQIVRLSDFKGKYVLVDFWASWCGPCRAENLFIVEAYRKYKDKGFTILGISLDDKSSATAWQKAIRDDGITWAQVSDLKGWKNSVAALYGVSSIPANFLVDPSGKIVAKNIKDKTLQNKLEELIGKH